MGLIKTPGTGDGGGTADQLVTQGQRRFSDLNGAAHVAISCKLAASCLTMPAIQRRGSCRPSVRKRSMRQGVATMCTIASAAIAAAVARSHTSGRLEMVKWSDGQAAEAEVEAT